MMVMVMAVCLYTVVSGAVKKENLVFVNFSAQDASILKISERSMFFYGFESIYGKFWVCFGILRTSS